MQAQARERKRKTREKKNREPRAVMRAVSCACARVCVVWLSSLLLRVFLCPMRRAVAARTPCAPSLCVWVGLRLCVSLSASRGFGFNGMGGSVCGCGAWWGLGACGCACRSDIERAWCT